MKYRLACFSFHYPPEYDAEGFVTAKWVSSLQSVGNAVDVFASDTRLLANRGSLSKSQLIADVFRYYFASQRLRTDDLSQIRSLTRYVQNALSAFETKHRNHPYDFIVSRYEPLGSAIAGYWASRRSGIPWIASYNDPIPRYFAQRTSPLALVDLHRRQFQANWLEDLLTVPSWFVFPSIRLQKLIEHFASKIHISLSSLTERSSIIPHIGGPLDSGGNHSIVLKKKEDGYVIRHLGYLSALRDPTTLLKALDLWETIADLPSIRVEFVGNSAAHSHILEQFMAGTRKKTSIQLLPSVSQDEAFSLMQTADVCLLIEEPASESVFLPSKFCDYAVAQRPILAITCKESTVGDYLVRYGGGYLVRHGHPDELVQSLRKMLVHQGEIPAHLSEEFSPYSVAEAWQHVFDQISYR